MKKFLPIFLTAFLVLIFSILVFNSVSACTNDSECNADYYCGANGLKYTYRCCTSPGDCEDSYGKCVINVGSASCDNDCCAASCGGQGCCTVSGCFCGPCANENEACTIDTKCHSPLLCCPVGSGYKCKTACTIPCQPDGCNNICPEGCFTADQDPDCGCKSGDNCCGIGCNNSDSDCDSSCLDRGAACTDSNKCCSKKCSDESSACYGLSNLDAHQACYDGNECKSGECMGPMMAGVPGLCIAGSSDGGDDDGKDGNGNGNEDGNGSGFSFSIPNPLKAASFEELINAIIGFVLIVSFAIVPLMILISAFYFMTSGGDPAKTKIAKDILLYTIIGFAVILFSKGLILVIQNILGVK
ncbi:MAG: pilin [Candidatus Pacebacteria bacterium]|nr:pilin [Candidatus Paceibacterota bacterium]